MEHQLQFEKLNLFNGDDLDKAAALSEVSVDGVGRSHNHGFNSLRSLYQDLRNANVRDFMPGSVIVRGIERDSGEPLSIKFRGTLRALDYCSRAIFGHDEYSKETAAGRRCGEADILVTIHPIYIIRSRTPISIRSPQWVRQELGIKDNWSRTISSMPNRLRKEIARLLRRYQYSVAVASDPDAIMRFKKEMLDPGLRQRFGNSAITSHDAQFAKQCSEMARLDLVYRGSVVASSLLEQAGDRLAIRKSAVRLDLPELRGRADVLDYFCLLLAQLLGCRVLDFGLSRPHLEDGTFRYKAKWGARVVSAGSMKADIHITPRHFSTAVRAFLRRSFFLQRRRSGFYVSVLYDDVSSKATETPLLRLADVDGVDAVELLCPAGTSPRELPSDRRYRVRLRDIHVPNANLHDGDSG